MASLGKDLALIRQEQELTLEEIYEATKISIRIIRSIEDDSIFNNINENPTYIRSYVRSYAKALSIDDKQIIYALDKVQKNEYSGSLQNLLKEKPKKSFEYDEEESEEDNGITSDQYEEQTDDIVTDPSSAFNKNKPGASQKESPSEAHSVPISDPNHPDVKSVDWADMGRKFQPLKSVGSRTWISLITVLILAFVAGVVFYFYNSGTLNNTDTTATSNATADQQRASSDTLSADSMELNILPVDEDDTSRQSNTNTVVTEEAQNKNLTELPDTLSLVVYAAYGKLEPVRVFTDIMDDINPYWIEQGEALRFNFVNEIRIRGQYSRMVLLFNGHLVQNFREEFYNPNTRLLEIDRSYFEGNPQWLQAASDSLSIDAPPPHVIRERPTFN